MELERQRGISISSAVLQFPYGDKVINLLDTPGHRDFSEDTYRVLAAVDAVIMVLDTAKGIESQTLKLFQVCRSRNLPVITFFNKYDRPGRDPLELLDEVEEQIGLRPTPATWPVGIPGDFRGVIDRRSGEYIRFTRTARGASLAPEELVDREVAAREEGSAWQTALDGCGLLEAIGADVDMPSFLAGKSTPVFVGSALTNFGVRMCSTPWPTTRRHRNREKTSKVRRDHSSRRSRLSCSKCRPTWIPIIGTASPSRVFARVSSSARWT